MKQFKSNNTLILVLERGEDLNESLLQIAKENPNRYATIQGIGAVDRVSLNFLDFNTGKYNEKVLEEDLEMVSLNGNISTKENEPFVHIHGVFGDEKYQSWSGHINHGRVSVTAEITIQFIDIDISREFNDEVGIHTLTK